MKKKKFFLKPTLTLKVRIFKNLENEIVSAILAYITPLVRDHQSGQVQSFFIDT